MNDKVPDILFHYTSQEGLLGIIQGKEIFATEIRYLNDAMEFAYAIGFAITAIKWLKKKYFSSYPVLLEQTVSRLKRLEKQVGSADNAPIFVCSLSSVGDLLSQWRGYCPNANGYSLGFRFEKIDELAKYHGLALSRCLYREMDQTRKIKELLDQATSVYEAGRKSTLEWEARRTVRIEAAISVFMTGFLDIAPTLKDPKFEEESEWRLISHTGTSAFPLYFRVGKSMLIPYSKFPLIDREGDFSIAKIYVGPTPHKSLSAQSVRRLLRANTLNECIVESSSVPYVAW